MKKNNTLNIILVLAATSLIAVLLYGGQSGWFKIGVTMPAQTALPSQVTPQPQQPTMSSCAQVCTAQGYSKNYPAIGDCKAGESRVTYGYPNQAPLLICCCYNEPIPPPEDTCIDSDGGQDITKPGTVTKGTDSITDTCSNDNKAVYEYYCQGNSPAGNVILCPANQVCKTTRSGAYCGASSSGGWNAGDIVLTSIGTGSLTAGSITAGPTIDLSEHGFIPGTSCTLSVNEWTHWNPQNPACPQGEKMKWDLYDSAGVRYSHTDNFPCGWDITLDPPTYNFVWDGTNDWKLVMTKTSNNPPCNVDYNYRIIVKINSCT